VSTAMPLHQHFSEHIHKTLLTNCRSAAIHGSNSMPSSDCHHGTETVHTVRRRCIRYRDAAGNTVKENSSVFSLIRMR